MSKPVEHWLDVYDACLHLAPDRKAWARLRRDHDILAEEPGAQGRTTFAVWQPDEPGHSEPHLFVFIDVATCANKPADLVNICAHEATHAAGQLLSHLGHKELNGSDEPHAYLVGWLTEWLWTGCQKTVKKLTKETA